MARVLHDRTDIGGTQTFPADTPVVDALDTGPVIALVVQYEGGSEVAALRPGAPLIVGRAPAQGLCIAHATLSREHARFELVAGRVVVDDLGSKNGVLFDARYAKRVEI